MLGVDGVCLGSCCDTIDGANTGRGRCSTDSGVETVRFAELDLCGGVYGGRCENVFGNGSPRTVYSMACR